MANFMCFSATVFVLVVRTCVTERNVCVCICGCGYAVYVYKCANANVYAGQKRFGNDYSVISLYYFQVNKRKATFRKSQK